MQNNQSPDYNIDLGLASIQKFSVRSFILSTSVKPQKCVVAMPLQTKRIETVGVGKCEAI